MSTVLSGISGALYYKPAGTVSTFVEAAVDTTADTITFDAYLNFKAGDPVQFSVVNTITDTTGVGTLPAPLVAGTTYYILSYNTLTGAAQVSATSGGTHVNLSDDGTLAAPNKFKVSYSAHTAVAEVRDWSLELSRSEIDVTTIGQAMTQFAPFRQFISGFAEASGSATVYLTDEDAAFGNRMVEDVLLRKQVGASMKLYFDQVVVNGVVVDSKSRFVSMDTVLTSASMGANPDDGQQVAINFRPTGNVSWDFRTT